MRSIFDDSSWNSEGLNLQDFDSSWNSEDQLYFDNLPKPVQEALKLLKKRANEAFKGLGGYDLYDSPIFSAYGVETWDRWEWISKPQAEKLISLGWNKEIYEAFLCWYGAKDEKLKKYAKWVLDNERKTRVFVIICYLRG